MRPASAPPANPSRTRWALPGLIALALAVAPLLTPSLAGLPGAAAPAHATVCDDPVTNCKVDSDVTLSVPEREKTPEPPAPPAQPPAAPAPSGTTSWNTNSPTTNSTTNTTPAATDPKPTAPKVGEAPKKGAKGASFKDEPHPQPGDTAVIVADGFTAGEQVQLVIFGKPVVIGSVTADEAGHVEYEFKIPNTLLPGTHTAELTGWVSGTVKNVEFVIEATNWATPDDSRVWAWWLLGGIIAALLAALAVLIVIRRRADRSVAAVTL